MGPKSLVKIGSVTAADFDFVVVGRWVFTNTHTDKVMYRGRQKKEELTSSDKAILHPHSIIRVQSLPYRLIKIDILRNLENATANINNLSWQSTL